MFVWNALRRNDDLALIFVVFESSGPFNDIIENIHKLHIIIRLIYAVALRIAGNSPNNYWPDGKCTHGPFNFQLLTELFLSISAIATFLILWFPYYIHRPTTCYAAFKKVYAYVCFTMQSSSLLAYEIDNHNITPFSECQNNSRRSGTTS